MSSIFRIFCSAVVLLALTTGLAQAQQSCQSEPLSATSRLYISKTLGAYPGSWTAWKEAAKAKYGNGWQAWSAAKNQSIECERVRNASGRNRWQCTRTAIACQKGGGGGTVAEICDGPAITRNLRQGDRGDQVKTLQCLLKEYHGADVEIDGVFGAGTRKAVLEFQKKYNLGTDGVVGDRTLEKLLS